MIYLDKYENIISNFPGMIGMLNIQARAIVHIFLFLSLFLGLGDYF